MEMLDRTPKQPKSMGKSNIVNANVNISLELAGKIHVNKALLSGVVDYFALKRGVCSFQLHVLLQIKRNEEFRSQPSLT